MKTTLLVPDVQWPYHDQLMVDKLLRVIKDIQPEQIVQIGDGIDFPQVSRWSVGTAGAYAPTLQKHITSYREKFLEPIVSLAPKAKRIWLRGNHDERLEDFIQKYAPALSSLDCLSMESLFKLGKSWSYERGPIRIGTNVYAIHGHEAPGYAASSVSRSFPSYVTSEDTEGHLWVHMYENKSWFSQVVQEGDGWEARIAAVLRKQATIYCAKEKAAVEGYSPEDLFRYTIPKLRDLLADAFEYENWQSFGLHGDGQPTAKVQANRTGDRIAELEIGRAHV